jgi:hypothetical protein
MTEDLDIRQRRPFGTALCRFPECDRRATQGGWGCQPHWFKLSPELRAAIHRAFTIECAANGHAGKAWEAADATAQVWLRKHGCLAPPRPTRRGPQMDLPL